MTNTKDAPADKAPELWDANDVARYLKVSRSWVYQRTEAGLLPCLRLGGLLRFDPDTVRAFARGDLQPPKMLNSPVLRRERTVDWRGGRAMLMDVKASGGQYLDAGAEGT